MVKNWYIVYDSMRILRDSKNEGVFFKLGIKQYQRGICVRNGFNYVLLLLSESSLSTEAEPVYDFIAHFSDLKVTETNIR